MIKFHNFFTMDLYLFCFYIFQIEDKSKRLFIDLYDLSQFVNCVIYNWKVSFFILNFFSIRQ